MLQTFANERKKGALPGQAATRPTMRSAAPPVASFGNQALLRQPKKDCACGGQCSSCEAKADRPPVGFIGELADVFQLAPDEGEPSPTPEVAGPAPRWPGEGAGPCASLCARAYADPALNQGGGGVVCEKGVKCACVFDVSPLTRGQCPGFDAIVMNHERRHLPEADCAADAPLSRLGPRTGVNLTAVECTHRRESIAEIDAILPGSAGICRTGMQSIRADLAAWVSANCGSSP